MALSPDDIVNYEFKQELRGYARSEVDDLLDRVADQVERFGQDVDELRQRLRDTEARLAAALETESTLKRTFVTAQQAAERALDDAREQADELRDAAEREVTDQLARATAEAEELVANARAVARDELSTAREEHAAVKRRVEQLAELERNQLASLRRQLEQQLAALDAAAPVTDSQSAAAVAPVGGPALTVRVRGDAEGDDTTAWSGDPVPVESVDESFAFADIAALDTSDRPEDGDGHGDRHDDGRDDERRDHDDHGIVPPSSETWRDDRS